MGLFDLTEECWEASQGRYPAHDPKEPGRKRPTSIRVFKNGFIETVFGQAHPITPIVWFGPLIAYGIYRGIHSTKYGSLGIVSLFIAGWLAWTLMEYTLHRYAFHAKAETPSQKFRVFMAHGYHHEFPNDGMRLVAPPLMSWTIAAVVVPLYYFVLGPDYFGPVIAGTTTGYIAYDWIHYYTHHFRPTLWLGKWLRSYHMHHHFDTPEKRYGVSNPLWDFVFGTYRKVPSVSNKRGQKPSSRPPLQVSHAEG